MEKAKEFYELDDESQQLKQNAEQKLYDSIIQTNFENLLEVGCGDGHLLNKFQNKNIFGIDINEDMLSLAKNLEGKLSKINIVSDLDFILLNKEKFDIVVSNYVFTELKQKDILEAFRNIYSLLKNEGKFCFTITDPRTRHKKEFPGYKLIFDEEYNYSKEDLEFKVLLCKKSGEFVDVGIRDYHQPLEVYDSLLKQAGFKNIQRTDINKGAKDNYAILYTLQK